MISKSLLFGILMCVSLAHSEDATHSTRSLSAERISLYEVPLVCPTAPKIGCGSRSKPILLALEQQPAVAEAWLHRSGTMLAIVWKAEVKRKARAAVLKTVTRLEDFKAREMSGTTRADALKGFLSGQNWFRGRDVDRLSEEEAGIVAARLVRRIQAKVPVTDKKAEALQVEFTKIFRRRFTGADDQAETDPAEQVLSAMQGHLDEKDIAVLKESLPRNLRPLPGEN